jgi:hypothetical protein
MRSVWKAVMTQISITPNAIFVGKKVIELRDVIEAGIWRRESRGASATHFALWGCLLLALALVALISNVATSPVLDSAPRACFAASVGVGALCIVAVVLARSMRTTYELHLRTHDGVMTALTSREQHRIFEVLSKIDYEMANLHEHVRSEVTMLAARSQRGTSIATPQQHCTSGCGRPS